MFDFKTYSIKDYFLFAFGVTFVILSLIAYICVHMAKPNWALANKAVVGIIYLATFAVGYAVGVHNSGAVEKAKWTVGEIVQALAAFALLVLSISVMGSIAAKNADAAKRSMNGVGVLALAMGFAVAVQKGDKIPGPTLSLSPSL